MSKRHRRLVDLEWLGLDAHSLASVKVGSVRPRLSRRCHFVDTVPPADASSYFPNRRRSGLNDSLLANHDGSDAPLLDDDRIIATVLMLQHRIEDRFPDSGLAKLCGRLHAVACRASERAAMISRPIAWIRVSGYLIAISLVLVLTGLIALAVQSLGPEAIAESESIGLLGWIQAIESTLNDMIFFGIAIFFLVSLENRIKRRRALAAIHELRSIAHVIDMHQLTKDPERFWREGTDTRHSPKHAMTPFLLNRYLDYCSEMLSLTGKIAALYVQKFDDADAVAAVSEVEQLTSGLSRKIWQKIMILEQFRESKFRIDAARVDATTAAAPKSKPEPTLPTNDATS